MVYDVESGTALEPMQGNQASSHVDVGYTERFCIHVLTSVSFYTWDSVPMDSLESHQANQGFLHV